MPVEKRPKFNELAEDRSFRYVIMSTLGEKLPAAKSIGLDLAKTATVFRAGKFVDGLTAELVLSGETATLEYVPKSHDGWTRHHRRYRHCGA